MANPEWTRLKREAIEDKRWNGIVHFALNDFPYGYTWYLDQVAPDWDGLILGDYEAVFPLVHGRKWGISYIYPPFFAQQLGIFSGRMVKPKEMTALLSWLAEEFPYIEMQFNFMHEPVSDVFQVSSRENLQLYLDKPYEMLKAACSTNHQRNMDKSHQKNLKIVTDVKPEVVVSFFRAHVGKRIYGLKDRHYHTLHRIIYQSLHYGMGTTAGVQDAAGNLLAVQYLVFSKNRIVNLLPAANAEGRRLKAGFLLMDYWLRLFADSRKIFDFEGSRIPSIAQYYRGFGAESLPYWHLKQNRLPWYLKPFKR